MKYARVDGERQTALRGASGVCPECDGPVIAKCGTKIVHHWAHKVRSNCNSRWENEGPWHQAWKNHFPERCQEIVHFDQNGEKHVADVKTDRGCVLEFQHSFLSPEERRARNAYYSPKLAWVIDALRRKTDFAQLARMMSRASRLDASGMYWIASADSCRLVKEWSGSDAQILFDLGPELGLWWMVRQLSNEQVLFARCAHTDFINAHTDGDFDDLVRQIGGLVDDYERLVRSRSRIRLHPSIPAPRRRIRRRRNL